MIVFSDWLSKTIDQRLVYTIKISVSKEVFCRSKPKELLYLIFSAGKIKANCIQGVRTEQKLAHAQTFHRGVGLG